MYKLLIFCFFSLAYSSVSLGQQSIAREWNEVLIEAIRNDFARPTVHARNLFHTSVAMYDTWSAVTGKGEPYLLGDTIGIYISRFPGFELDLSPEEEEAYVEEAISFAALGVIAHRFRFSPDYEATVERIVELMEAKGYDISQESDGYPQDTSAAAFGAYVAEEVIFFGLLDNADDLRYRNEFYQPVNEPLLVSEYGGVELNDPNRWQPLAFDRFIDQSGNEILGVIPEFLSPEWGEVTPFALSEDDLTIFQDSSGNDYYVYHDPGLPPLLSEDGLDQSSIDYRWGFSLVGIWSSMLDPSDGVMWDISPAALGNTSELPSDFDGFRNFYDLENGGDGSQGRDINPVTGEPYQSQMVPRADYARVLAEFWADGPDSETPPGHWFTILHKVMDHPEFSRNWEGSGQELDSLEYDLRAFFTLGGAMHDAAVTTWGTKGWYDYIRPISSIRYMAGKGQSSDVSLPNYHPHGLPLIPGYYEIIEEGDPLTEADSTLVGKMKMYSWKGPDFIENEDTDVAGVGWIPAENWWPYQRPTFVSPPFAGYTSGHSCFSRAAAEVLTMMTGDEFFPGGIGVFPAKQNEFLVFEDGPSVDIDLQWATYRDASDQTSLSRIWGGIHPPQDDIPGRLVGIEVGIDAFNKANSYFEQVNTSTYEEVLMDDLFSVYPNPVSNKNRLFIELPEENYTKEIRIELFDALSRRVRSELIRPTLTGLDLRGLDNGTYYLHLIMDGKRQVSEVVIIN